MLAVLTEIDAGIDSGARLTGGASDMDGVVELYRDGRWFLVCDDWFDEKDARVICRMVGAADGKPMLFTTFSNVNSNPYDRITGIFGYSDLGCAGTESTVEECTHDRSPRCGNEEQVGLKCHSQGGAQWTHPPTSTATARTMAAASMTTTTATALAEHSSTKQPNLQMIDNTNVDATTKPTVDSIVVSTTVNSRGVSTGVSTIVSTVVAEPDEATTGAVDAEHSDVDEASMTTPVLIIIGVLAAILTAVGAGLAAMVLGRRKKGSETSSPGSSMSGSSDWSESTI